jgi:hypothetical protein
MRVLSCLRAPNFQKSYRMEICPQSVNIVLTPIPKAIFQTYEYFIIRSPIEHVWIP